MYLRESEGARESAQMGGGAEEEGQAGIPIIGPHPRTPGDHNSSQRPTSNQLSHPCAPGWKDF